MNEKNKPTFPKSAVKRLRNRHELSQVELAARLGTSQGSVSRWENPDDELYPRGAVAVLLRQMAKEKNMRVRS